MSAIGSGPPPTDANEHAPRWVSVRDIVVVPAPGHRADPDEWDAFPPVDAVVDLGDNLHVGRLGGDVQEAVIAACMPRGEEYDPARQFGPLYSFWRDISFEEGELPSFNWEGSPFAEALALARLVQDNAHCMEFSARVFERVDGFRRIAPVYGFEARVAYTTRKARSWLTAADAAELRVLLDQHRAIQPLLPARARRALWHAERSTQRAFLTEAVASIVTGLEALLSIRDDGQPTKQFLVRSKALAEELGIATSRSYWDWVYDARSLSVHGGESRLVAPAGWAESADDPPEDVVKIAKAQDVLRAAVRRTIEDEDFRGVFADDGQLRTRWPIDPVTKTRGRRGRWLDRLRRRAGERL